MTELVLEARSEFRFVVVSRDLDDALRPMVDQWLRVHVPNRPAPLRFIAFYVRAGFRIRHVHFDLLHTLGAIVPNRCDIASVHSCHAGSRAKTGALAPREGARLRRLNTTILHAMALAAERWTYRRARSRRIAVVSQDVGVEIQQHFSGVHVSVTPNGVDQERFVPNPSLRTEVRHEHAVGNEDVVAIFVGGLWEHKGLHLAVEGVNLAQEHTAVRLHLWVLGAGDPGWLSDRVDVSRTTLLGRRDDTERFYAGADFLVLPSMYEAAPLVAYEAAAVGIPIVATRVGGVSELVGEDEGCGILVERSSLSVSRAIERLASDPKLRVEMGAEGRRRVSANTWSQSARSVMHIYHDLLSSSTNRPQACNE